jgi:hypothetical protein
MEVFVLILHFDLPREEYLFSVRTEEVAQLSRCVALARIIEPLTNLVVAKIELVILRQGRILPRKTLNAR